MPVVDLLAPPILRRLPPAGASVADMCASACRALPWLRGPAARAARCRAIAPAARRRGAAFDLAWAPLAYEGVARDLVRALKFRAALPGRAV